MGGYEEWAIILRALLPFLQGELSAELKGFAIQGYNYL